MKCFIGNQTFTGKTLVWENHKLKILFSSSVLKVNNNSNQSKLNRSKAYISGVTVNNYSPKKITPGLIITREKSTPGVIFSWEKFTPTWKKVLP